MMRLVVVLLLVALTEGRVLQQLRGGAETINAQIAGLAAHDVIAKAVANGGRDTAAATRNSINYAKMANSVARPYMFDDEGYGARRHLLQSSEDQRSDRIQMASMAAQDAIGKAVASAGKTTGVATRKGVDYAQMANRGGSVQPYMFDDTGAKRHLLNGGYQRSDKMQMAGMAAQDAISKAVASAGRTTGVATRKGVDYAQMANRGGSVQPYMFDDTGAKR